MRTLKPAAGLIAVVSLVACGQQGGNAAVAEDAEENPGGIVTELIIEDVQAGSGEEAASGTRVTVHYTGWLYEPAAEGNRGTKFDSSVDRGQPFDFALGAGQVIRGWDDGVAGMKVGGRRILTIPPDMAYGDTGAGGVIPSGATLVFEVELLDVD